MMAYYHADRLNYAVCGTPNRLEYDQGFFVKGGDGLADFKPIAHLYKTQVFEVARALGVPVEILERTPTTDTFSLAQTQEEFYFALPYGLMDLCLYGTTTGCPPVKWLRASDSRPIRWSACTATSMASGAGHSRCMSHHFLLRRCRRSSRCSRPPPHHPLNSPGRMADSHHVRYRRDCHLTDRGETPPAGLLARMIGMIRHRGPDEYGMYRDGHAGLVHARLSIIDLASGQQPLANEDGSLWIIFNGEIFNYVELREELETLGHRFRTRSDTEVIVHAFEAWGEECFARFNGQWALALWDSRRRRLVLARDGSGSVPCTSANPEARSGSPAK